MSAWHVKTVDWLFQADRAFFAEWRSVATRSMLSIETLLQGLIFRLCFGKALLQRLLFRLFFGKTVGKQRLLFRLFFGKTVGKLVGLDKLHMRFQEKVLGSTQFLGVGDMELCRDILIELLLCRNAKFLHGGGLVGDPVVSENEIIETRN
jgi:hypothetical protein